MQDIEVEKFTLQELDFFLMTVQALIANYRKDKKYVQGETDNTLDELFAIESKIKRVKEQMWAWQVQG